MYRIVIIVDEISVNLIIICEMQIVRKVTYICVNYHLGSTLVKSSKKL